LKIYYTQLRFNIFIKKISVAEFRKLRNAGHMVKVTERYQNYYPVRIKEDDNRTPGLLLFVVMTSDPVLPH